MKKTTTRTKEVWIACGCGGSCNLCNGTGKFLSEVTTETITEETSQLPEDVVEAEVVYKDCLELNSSTKGRCFDCGKEDVVGRWMGTGTFMCGECLRRRNEYSEKNM